MWTSFANSNQLTGTLPSEWATWTNIVQLYDAFPFEFVRTTLRHFLLLCFSGRSVEITSLAHFRLSGPPSIVFLNCTLPVWTYPSLEVKLHFSLFSDPCISMSLLALFLRSGPHCPLWHFCECLFQEEVCLYVCFVGDDGWSFASSRWLHGNSLTGTLPSELSALTNMISLYEISFPLSSGPRFTLKTGL